MLLSKKRMDTEMIPKKIPCVHCGADVVVIVRDVAGGLVKYVGVKCAKCGMYLFATGHSEESPDLANKSALIDLRKMWSRARNELELIRAEVLETTGSEDRVLEVYRDRQTIKATRGKPGRR